MAAFRGKTDLSERAFNIIEDPEREFIVSDYLKLELLPKATYFGNREELAFYNEFLDAAVICIELGPDSATDALALASRYGLSALDALHISVAKTAGAEFVTAEKPGKPYSRVTEISVRTIHST